MLSRFQNNIKRIEIQVFKTSFLFECKAFHNSRKVHLLCKKKKKKEKKHAYDNENTKRIDITRECSISPTLRTDQVHHQVQIPSWVSKLIKNPK